MTTGLAGITVAVVNYNGAAMLGPTLDSVLAQTGVVLRAVLVVELSAGQLVDDVRLSLVGATPIRFLGRMGGMLPMPTEIVEALRAALAEAGAGRTR